MPHVIALPINEWVYQFLASRPIKTGYVLRFPDGRQLNVPYVSHRFSKYARLAGFPVGYHFHTLRHTGATWLVQDGVSIYAVQKLLGHSNIQVTMMYSHLITSEMQDCVNRINIREILSPPLTLIPGACYCLLGVLKWLNPGSHVRASLLTPHRVVCVGRSE